jgi:hypothetical protein
VGFSRGDWTEKTISAPNFVWSDTEKLWIYCTYDLAESFGNVSRRFHGRGSHSEYIGRCPIVNDARDDEWSENVLEMR